MDGHTHPSVLSKQRTGGPSGALNCGNDPNWFHIREQRSDGTLHHNEARIWKPPPAAPGQRRARRSMDVMTGLFALFCFLVAPLKGVPGMAGGSACIGRCPLGVVEKSGHLFTTGSPADYSSDWGPPT
jgi:hypothetical protein